MPDEKDLQKAHRPYTVRVSCRREITTTKTVRVDVPEGKDNSWAEEQVRAVIGDDLNHPAIAHVTLETRDSGYVVRFFGCYAGTVSDQDQPYMRVGR